MEAKVLPDILAKVDYPLNFYAVYAGQSKKEWRAFRRSFRIPQKNVRLVHLWDPEIESDYLSLYGVISTPKLYLTAPDGTIIGWKECIVPEEAQADTLTFIAEIAYGTTIKFQDYTTLKEKFGDPERMEICFTLARNHTFRHLRGETAQAVAELTMGQLDITGVVRLVSPEQAASWTAWQNGEDSGGVDVIVCWNLYQNGELVSQDLYGASSVPETGEGVVFDGMYPRMDNLSGLTLVPEYAEAGEKPEEAITLTK